MIVVLGNMNIEPNTADVGPSVSRRSHGADSGEPIASSDELLPHDAHPASEELVVAAARKSVLALAVVLARQAAREDDAREHGTTDACSAEQRNS